MNQTVALLTEQVINSYSQVGGINHLDGKNLPSKTAIASITADLLVLVFPGFFEEKSVHSSEIKGKTTTLMHSVVTRLEEEIYKSLEYAPPPNASKKELRKLARTEAVDFLTQLPRIREIMQTDAEAAYEGNPAALSKAEVIVANPFH